MTQSHGECDALFAAAEEAVSTDAAEAHARFDAFRQETERHFVQEESLLFPELERRTGMTAGPTQVMRMEHDQMRSMLEAMADSLAQGDTQQFLGLSETLLIYMQQHNIKEQTVLYPMLDRVLADEAAAFVERLQRAGEASA
jgi:iron-sulfur cluster repair protein YtfE (RIC family)